jgi:hypothetical protein
MPRYYFAIEGSPPEDEGTELPDDAAAFEMAENESLDFGYRRRKHRPTILVFNEAGVLMGRRPA